MFFVTTHKNGRLVNHFSFESTELMHEWLKRGGYKKGTTFGWYANGETEVLTERLAVWDEDPKVCVTLYDTNDHYRGHLAFSSGDKFYEWLKANGCRKVADYDGTPSAYGWYISDSKSTVHYEGSINLIDESF